MNDRGPVNGDWRPPLSALLTRWNELIGDEFIGTLPHFHGWDFELSRKTSTLTVSPFRFDIDTYERCGGNVKIIASIEDPAVVGRILAHLQGREPAGSLPADVITAHRTRGPPEQGMFDLN